MPPRSSRAMAARSYGMTVDGPFTTACSTRSRSSVAVISPLVKTSGEITATLDLDRVLQAVVNGPSTVIPYERAAIALDERGGMRLKAVSGTTQLNADDPQYRGLREVMQWAAILSEPLLVTQQGDEIDSDREETR